MGTKEFEIRVNDRNFKVGDALCLREWLPDEQKYTDRHVFKRVTYMIQGEFGLPENLCVMQLR